MKERPLLPPVFSLAFLLVFLFAFGMLALAAAPQPETNPETAIEGETPAPTATGLLEGLIETRAPEPTATPGPLARELEERAGQVGITRSFGINRADWVNLLISFLAVVIGYVIGSWFIHGALPPVVRRTPTEFDDRLLKTVGSDLRWLVVVLVLRFATVRLDFLGVGLKRALTDIYFVLGLAIAFRVTWKLIDFTSAWYRERLEGTGRLEELDPIMILMVRLARLTALWVGASIGLDHFGINVTAFAAAIGIGGLAISLAAQDTISDAINGFIILVDQPFRVGDRIEIQGVGTWGDVVEIGLRTTRVRTRDNRLVIVPNSMIGNNQVINYTFPDPRYRIQTHIGIGYGTDIATARGIIIDTVRQVEGVLAGKPVDALYVEMGDTAMVFRVRWWIESYEDTRRMFDRVHTALQERLDEAGIEMPFPTYDVNIKLDAHTQDVDRLKGELAG
jgi:small-conductance mechanosensitive channel